MTHIYIYIYDVKFKIAGAVTKRLVHCACQFPWYVKIMMMYRITQKKGNNQWSHSRAGKREKTDDTQCIVKSWGTCVEIIAAATFF